MKPSSPISMCRQQGRRRPSMIPKILFLVEEICPRTSQIYNLGTAIPILFQSRAFKTVERITDPFATAHDALVLIVSEGAFVADAHESRWTHVGVAHGAFAIAFIAESSDRDTRLLTAHNEIGVVAGHGCDAMRFVRSSRHVVHE